MLDLAYSEIMDGHSIHSMVTGLFRGGKTIMTMLDFVPWAMADHHDLRALSHYWARTVSNFNMDSAFVKFGQLQLEYQEVKHLWLEGKYGDAGSKAAEGLAELAD